MSMIIFQPTYHPEGNTVTIIMRLKPATHRPYVTAFLLSGTVPAFRCDSRRFVSAFTRRRKLDLCVSTSLRTMLAFGNNVSCSSSACSTPAFCRRLHGREYAGIQALRVDQKMQRLFESAA